MSSISTIEWTNATWNPTRGCKKVTPGCALCYAERFAERFRGVPGHSYEQGFDPRVAPEVLAEPLRWASAKKVFVNSMSDLFLPEFEVQYLERVVSVMRAADWHTYQVLTKRHERMRELLAGPLAHAAMLPHVWWGVSVENRRHGLPRIEALRHTPAVVRFLSIEPLLEDLGPIDLTGIHWVIVGGESGKRPRPMNANWARSLRDQCAAAGVPFFFKQWGGTQKKKAGRELDGRTHDDMPRTSNRPVPPKKERDALAKALGVETSGQRVPLQLAEVPPTCSATLDEAPCPPRNVASRLHDEGHSIITVPDPAEGGRRIAEQLDAPTLESLRYYLYSVQRKLVRGQLSDAMSKLMTLEKSLGPRPPGGSETPQAPREFA